VFKNCRVGILKSETEIIKILKYTSCSNFFGKIRSSLNHLSDKATYSSVYLFVARNIDL
jgi:hypothetical protein